MSIAIREQVRVAPDRSVHVSSPLLEPGAKAEVIVLVDASPAPGKPYSSFDVMRANPILPERSPQAGGMRAPNRGHDG